MTTISSVFERTRKREYWYLVTSKYYLFSFIYYIIAYSYKKLRDTVYLKKKLSKTTQVKINKNFKKRRLVHQEYTIIFFVTIRDYTLYCFNATNYVPTNIYIYF